MYEKEDENKPLKQKEVLIEQEMENSVQQEQQKQGFK